MQLNFRLAFLLLSSVVVSFAEWVPIGPDGGSAHVLAIDPQNDSHLLAGSRGLSLYSSDDAGASWTIVPDFAEPMELYQAALNVVLIDPADSRTFYAGISASNARPAAENGAGLYKTTDGGQHWTRVPTLAGVSVYCLAIWEKDRHVMVAGTHHGVYRSSDSGQSWESLTAEGELRDSGVMSIAIDPKNSAVIYAGTPHLPWKTSDGGKTWHNIHSGMSDDSDVFSIKIDQRNPERVYASACSGIYGSSSAGNLWSKLQGIPFTNRRTHVIAQDPRHGSTLYAATTMGLWKSTNGGASWRHNSEDSINALVLDSKGVLYLAEEQRGLVKSEDGGETFHDINHGYINRSLTTLQAASDAGRPFLYASTIYDGRWGGLFRTEDASGKWELLANEAALHERNLTSFAALAGSRALVAASYDGFLRSNDDGRTWTDMASGKAPEAMVQKGAAAKAKGRAPARAASRPVPGKVEGVVFPSPKVHIYGLKASTGKHPYLVAATSAGLFYSTTGADWKAMKIIQSKYTLPVTAVFVSPGDTGGLAAITPGGLFLSHDRGTTWISTALPYKPDVIYELAFDYQDPNLVIAATSDGIYNSRDGGKSWEFHYGGMEKGEVTSVIFHPLHHGEAYALHARWVYKTVDGGNHWKLFDRTGLNNVTFRTITFGQSESDPQLYGLAPLRGVFVYHTPSLKTRQNVTASPQTASN